MYFFRTFSWSNIMSCWFYWKRTRLLSFKRPLHGLWLSIKCRNKNEFIRLFLIVRQEVHSNVIIFLEFLELFAITFVVNNLQSISFLQLVSNLHLIQNKISTVFAEVIHWVICPLELSLASCLSIGVIITNRRKYM